MTSIASKQVPDRSRTGSSRERPEDPGRPCASPIGDILLVADERRAA